MRSMTFASVFLLTLCAYGCTNLAQDRQKQKAERNEVTCTARFVPVGNNPDIALDSQTGMLCRTVSDTNDPLGILDPACAVDEQGKKLGFVPVGCSGGKTWVRGSSEKGSDTNDPLGIWDPACAVDEQGKKLGFVPVGCSGGKTWVRGSSEKGSLSRYANLPVCRAVRDSSK
jgi:hypothetical protein